MVLFFTMYTCIRATVNIFGTTFLPVEIKFCLISVCKRIWCLWFDLPVNVTGKELSRHYAV